MNLDHPVHCKTQQYLYARVTKTCYSSTVIACLESFPLHWKQLKCPPEIAEMLRLFYHEGYFTINTAFSYTLWNIIVKRLVYIHFQLKSSWHHTLILYPHSWKSSSWGYSIIEPQLPRANEATFIPFTFRFCW